ncbi:hypothetical protein I6U48_26690 [Clostridium sp. PL3]|uniref:Uncharacterized protein n=1 Tax=Clostridium thailandense TaxID=2794346 RepID=A0A949U163_9CLOT|nr:hypothetical protein [Clostridium thailandense]MBV7276473.1 hypothetical protein [Clostridium thailandense]
MSKINKKQKRKTKHSMLQKIKNYTKNKWEYLAKIYDKYGRLLVSWITILLLIPASIIGVIGICRGEIYSPIVWLSISYALIFGLKNSLIKILDSSKYSMSFQLVANIIKLILCLFFLPTVLTMLSTLLKLTDTKVLFIVPILNYVGFKFFTSILSSYYFYNGFSKKTFWIAITSILGCILIQIGIIITMFLNISLYEFIYLKYGITKAKILIFIIINLAGNIIILINTFMKNRKIKNWREITIDSTLYRYNHIKGHIKQIFKEGIGGIFFPIPKYSRYKEINNFNISMDWTRLANKLYREKEPDPIEMMINNEFLSNPLFRMYIIALNWSEPYARIFRNSYLLLGILFNQRGVYLLYETGNPIDSKILIVWGTLLIWLAILGYIASISRTHEFKKLKIGFIITVFLYNIGHIILYFDVYRNLILFDVLIFVYFYISHIFILNKVKKSYRYKYFNMLNI